MDKITVIGILASVFTGIALVPQLLKLLKEKDPSVVSIPMISILLIGVGLWVVYGVLKDDWIIIVSNSFSWIVNLMIILLTIKYKIKPR